jgi:DUF1680 family protein
MLLAFLVVYALFAPCATARAAERHATLSPVGVSDARWTGGLMGERFETCRKVMVPNLWHIMSGTEYSQFFENFRIAAGLSQGKHRGAPFNDGDFYKWLESAAATYAITHDQQLDRTMDDCIAVIAKAQRADGYIHTPVLLKKRGPDTHEFVNPLDFEMYNMGHLMTAAVVHHRATGKTTLLDVAKKAADFLDKTFANPTPDLARFGVCPSHYMGLVDLYRETKEPRYLALSQRLIDMRSLVKDGTDDNQDRVPFRQQTQAIGHAVRANYLYAGAADVYAETGDESLMSPLRKIWDDLEAHKIYITGGCGALYDGASPDGSKDQKSITRVHQAYGRDYQLPNATAHNETCAAIGSLLWNWRMLQISGDAKFADEMERVLYNSVLTGVSLDGTKFFYTNTLRKLDPEPVNLRWSRVRQPFISTFCCPPNVVRTIAESANYAYGVSDGKVWVNLYGAGECNATLPNNDGTVKLTQDTSYPWTGKVKITVDPKLEKPAGELSLMLRIPGWLSNFASFSVNGNPSAQPLARGRYFELRRTWASGDVVELDFPMPVRLMEANPYVEETRDQVAVMRGPLVYCLESNELPEGVRVLDVRVPREAKFTSRVDKDVAGGVVVVEGKATAQPQGDWKGRLYREIQPGVGPQKRDVDLRLVPYYAWGNRGGAEMTVWMSTAN